MATYTRDQLRDAVLTELGVLDPSNPPSPEDAALANDRVQQKLEYAYDQGLIWWDLDNDPIPARAFEHLTSWIAYRLVLPYGAITRASILKANAEEAETLLVDLADPPYVGLTQPTEPY